MNPMSYPSPIQKTYSIFRLVETRFFRCGLKRIRIVDQKRFVPTGITVKATRSSKALKKAATLLPNETQLLVEIEPTINNLRAKYLPLSS